MAHNHNRTSGSNPSGVDPWQAFHDELHRSTTAQEARTAALRAHRLNPGYVFLRAVNDYEAVPAWRGGPVGLMSPQMLAHLGGDESFIVLGEHKGLALVTPFV